MVEYLFFYLAPNKKWLKFNGVWIAISDFDLSLKCFIYPAGPINSSSRDMAMGSGFVEGNGSPAVSQLNSNTDCILS